MKLLKYAALLAVGLVLAACGGSAFAATNDLILNSADGRIYTFMDAQYITQTSPSSYTISYSPTLTQVIADSGGAQFARLASSPGFAGNWSTVHDYSGHTVYVNYAVALYAVCSGNNVTLGYAGSPGTANYVDTSCAAFNALKAGAN